MLFDNTGSRESLFRPRPLPAQILSAVGRVTEGGESRSAGRLGSLKFSYTLRSWHARVNYKGGADGDPPARQRMSRLASRPWVLTVRKGAYLGGR